MKIETITTTLEAAKGLIAAMLEDDEIIDFEITERASGECEVVMWKKD